MLDAATDARDGTHYLGVLEDTIAKLSGLIQEFDPDRLATELGDSVITEEGQVPLCTRAPVYQSRRCAQ